MIRFSVLGSGSKGNAVYVDVDGVGILLDAGLSFKAIADRLRECGKDIRRDITAVFISHAHKDHNGACRLIEKRCPMVEIYDDWVFDTFRMPGAINIAPFPLAHDEQAPCFGFTVQDRAGNKLGYVPDTHHVPEESLENLFDCQVLILEFNYHLNELIENCPYPDDLKERIALTHMENECSGETVSYLAWEGMKYLVPFHLSETNNSDDMVQYEADRGLGEYQENVTVIIARQKGWGGKVYTVI